MPYKPGVVRLAAPDRSVPQFANWPLDLAWWFIPSGDRNDLPGQYVDIHVKLFDAIAQKHKAECEAKVGQQIQMADGSIAEIPYTFLDAEADLMMQRGMQPSPDQRPLDFIRLKDGRQLPKVPRNWLEQLVVAHVRRRQSEPPVTYNLGQQQMQVSFATHDAICKDFGKRRDAMLAAGCWPELLIAENPLDPQRPGPMPVDGRGNALQKSNVMTPQQLAEQMARQAHMPVHPAENENVV